MTFTEARANVGVQLSDEALFAPPKTAPFAAQIDPLSGAITGGDLDVPAFSTFITDPIEADVTVEFEIGVITGSFNPATGGLILSGTAGGTLTASGGTLSSEGECTVSTDPSILTLTTTGSSGGANPRSGAPFLAGLAQGGAIAGKWTDMHATPVDPGPGGDTDFCDNVEGRIGGPGGVWLVQGDTAPPAPPQLASTDPASPSLSGTPRILGAAEAGSTVTVYGGSGCTGAPVATGSAAQLGATGIGIEVAEGVTAAFSATATDVAGNISACSAPISYTRLKRTDPPAPPAPECIVPELAGKTLAGAKAALTAASCKLGMVLRPKLKVRKGRILVVKSSNPPAGATPANGKVHLKLGLKTRKARG